MQLPLFENLWQDKANKLLESLNEGRKGKEVFEAGEVVQVNDKIILTAFNKEKQVYNILDEFGNLPKGFTMDWRNYSHLIHDYKNL